jgi:hypothetical protein
MEILVISNGLFDSEQQKHSRHNGFLSQKYSLLMASWFG